MARIPTFERRQGLDTAAGTIPSTRVDTSPAQALAGLGGTLVSVGERMNQREAQRQEFLAQQQFQRLAVDAEGDFLNAQRDIDPTGQGFHDTVAGSYQARSEQFLAGLPPRLQSQFGERVATLGERFSVRAAQTEIGQFDVYQTDETNRMLGELTTGIQRFGPGSLEDFQAQGEEIINSTSLPPTKKDELIRTYRRDAQRVAAAGLPPEQIKRALGDMFGISIPSATSSVVDRIIGVESGGNPTAKNPNSTATGLGQFIDSTWIATVRKHRPDIADGKSRSQLLALRSNAELSREMTQRYAEENASKIQGAGFQPTAGNVYLAHFLGPQGAIDMLRADPNAIAADINPGAAKANKSIFSRRGVPRTAAQIVAWAEQKMGGDRAATDIRRPLSDPDPRFADLTLEDRIKLLNNADKQIAINRQGFKDELDGYEAYLRDGNSPLPGFSRAELAANIGEEAAAAAEDRIKRAQSFGEDANAIRWATPEEVGRIIEERTSGLQPDGTYKGDRADIASLLGLVEQRNKEIKDDPAAYVNRDPEVSQRAQAMANAQGDVRAANDYVSATLALQERLGVPAHERRILSKEQAATIGRQFSDQPEGGQNAAQLMGSLKQQFGRHWPRVFAEIAPELPGAAYVVGAMDKPDQARAAEQLAEASLVGAKALEQQIPTDDKTAIKENVFAGLEPFRMTLTNSIGGDQAYTTFADSIYLLALSHVTRGDAPSKAAARAVDEVLGRKYSFEGTYRVPVDFDPTLVRRGADAVLTRAADAMNIEDFDIDLPQSLAQLDDEQTYAAYLSALRSNGFWVTSPDERGLILYEGTTRSAVTTQGVPLLLKFEDLVRIGNGASNIANQPPEGLAVP